MNERNVKDMNDQDLVNALREHAEWVRANEWETPITLGDDLVDDAVEITHWMPLPKTPEAMKNE